jgi:NDP-4-keto-2,6-dideoxyhexose 3-C-methyltransferase
MITRLEECRICGSEQLENVLDLGEQMLTGVFPRERNADVTTGPLQLVKCQGEGTCGLLQLAHSYDLGEMYGDNYGYRSGLNASMVSHLEAKVARIRTLVDLADGDLIIDIGSNDATTLRAYGQPNLNLVGVDPTGVKFREYYPDHVTLIPDFFSSSLVEERFPGARAKVVTSFSMFYDLPRPMDFMRQVHEVLADDGIWVFEQSYMPLMLKTNSYDTVCHEHLEFYALRQIQWMADRVGFQIIDVEFNDVNGGSFSITVRKGAVAPPLPAIQKILDDEDSAGLGTLVPYQMFAERVAETRAALRQFLDDAKARGERIGALGASTKGNVLLQYCGITPEDVVAVGEVNPEKYGALTPGTWLPIIPEQELLNDRADYLLVLPWHFRAFFERAPAFAGRKLLFPLPELDVVEVMDAAVGAA